MTEADGPYIQIEPATNSGLIFLNIVLDKEWLCSLYVPHCHTPGDVSGSVVRVVRQAVLKRELSRRGSELLRGHRESPIRQTPKGGTRMHLLMGMWSLTSALPVKLSCY